MNTDGIIEFVTDPLRLTLVVAAVVVVVLILLSSWRSKKQRDLRYKHYSEKNYSFGALPADTLVDEEVIVLPRRKKESEVAAEKASQTETDSVAKHVPGFSARGAGNRESATESFELESVEEPRLDSVASRPPPVVSKRPSPANLKVTPAPKPESKPSRHQAKKAKKKETTQQPRPAKPVKQQFVVLHIIADAGEQFGGQAIFEATQTLGMAMGKHNVFHYPADSAYAGDSAFCMVNMTPEGNFDAANLSQIQTNGVSLILTLPTTYSDGLTVFSNMIAVAHALVKKLGSGDIVDQTRMPLTAELMADIQADIVKFENQVVPTSPSPVLET